MTEPLNQPTPTFETRVFLHGVGSYVPHEDGNKLLVLFPDQDHAMERGIQAPEGGEICRHHMVVQMDARALDPSLPPNLWLTLDVAKHWIGFSSDSEELMNLEEGRIDGLADIETLLAGAGGGAPSGLDPRALPGAAFDSRLLAAGFYASQGAVGPSGEYQGPFQVGSAGQGWGEDRTLSSVIRVELGEIHQFSLKLRPFSPASAPVSAIPLHPVAGELEVWIRHFCDLEKPDPQLHEPDPGELDADFVLNYALLEDLESLLENGPDRLPVPRVSSSWERGVTSAGKPRQCMGYLDAARSFSDPMTS
jgi:hypothetical protein